MRVSSVGFLIISKIVALELCLRASAFTFPSKCTRTRPTEGLAWKNGYDYCRSTSELFISSANVESLASEENVDSKGNAAKLVEDLNDARQRAIDAETRVQDLMVQMKEYQEAIDEKRFNFESSRTNWTRQDRRAVMSKVSELQRQVRTFDKTTLPQEMQRRQEELESNFYNETVQDLQEALNATWKQLELQQEEAAALRERLTTSEDTLEFEQMKFQKEKASLEMELASSESRLRQAEKKLAQEQTQQRDELARLQDKLQQDSEKVQQAQTELDRAKQEFDTEQKQWNGQIQSLQSQIQSKEEEIQRQSSRASREKETLQQELDGAKQTLQQAQQIFDNKQAEFDATKVALQQRLDQERDRLVDMAQEMERDSKQFQQDRQEMQSTLTLERGKLASLQQELVRATKKFEQDRQSFEKELRTAIQSRQSQARDMNQRFAKRRAFLTDQWEQEKQNTRDEGKRLAAKYSKQLNAVKEDIGRLQGRLEESRKEHETTINQIQGMEKETQRAKALGKTTETKYQQLLLGQNLEIETLKDNVETLRSEVSDREEQLQQYEGSFMELAKLSRKLLWKRARKLLPFSRGRKQNNNPEQDE